MNKKIIIVGAGASGLMTAIRAAACGVSVDIFSILPPSMSDCSNHVGVNGCLKSTLDESDDFFMDSVKAGGGLANQDSLRDLCLNAEEIIELCSRIGVGWDRTEEGFPKIRQTDGCRRPRTVGVGSHTGRAIQNALGSQVHRFISQNRIILYSGWEYLSLIRDEEGRARGIVAENRSNMEVRAFTADSVIAASGGYLSFFGNTTNPGSGDVIANLYRAGALLANMEFVQFSPAYFSEKPKNCSCLVGQKGRYSIQKEGKISYFMEGMELADHASQALVMRRICELTREGYGVDGKPLVNLEITDLTGDLEIYKTIQEDLGLDPKKSPILVTPIPSYGLGGLWVDRHHQTNIPGLYAVGECQYLYHGAGALEGNLLLASLYGGYQVGGHIAESIQSVSDLPIKLLEKATKKELLTNRDLLDRNGSENLYGLQKELQVAVKSLGFVRTNSQLKETETKLFQLIPRVDDLSITDKSATTNQELFLARHLVQSLELAWVMIRGALARNESRGMHYKPEFPEPDENFLKTTRVRWSPDGPRIEYEDVNQSYYKAPRVYGKAVG